MKYSSDTLMKALMTTATIAIVLALTNYWLLFGFAVCALMMLALAVGFGAQLRVRPIPLLILGLFIAYVILLGAMALLDNPRGPINLILGFPAATAVLVYGIWPIAVAVGITYAITFKHTVLPPDRLNKFLHRFGKKDF